VNSREWAAELERVTETCPLPQLRFELKKLRRIYALALAGRSGDGLVVGRDVKGPEGA
jgi:hypothetical protein